MQTEVHLSDLASPDPKVKYACAKRLLALAKESPEPLCADRAFFMKMLDSQNNILKWTAIEVVGAIAAVGRDVPVERLVDRPAGFLNTGNMITANHAIGALAAVARERAGVRARIAADLLEVEHYEYATTECRNIAIGKAILALGTFCDSLPDNTHIIDFARRQTGNTRAATRQKAGQFLKKHAGT